MFNDFNIENITDNVPLLVVLGVLLLCVLVQICYYLYFFTGVIMRYRRARQGKISFSDKTPPISIIICAKNEAENLKEFLPSVLEQNYPDFEVIVVNDGSLDGTEEVLKYFRNKYSNLYFTNIPVGTKALSNKKLAVTIGIKAAKNEALLFTDADCCPVSKNWLSLMVRNLNSDTEFVLGFGDYMREKTLINRLITYDTLFIAMQYLGLAFRGLPYMAVGRNMMYRKSTFFRLKGFMGHLHIASGDDDLIVNRAATRINTAIESDKNSKTLSVPEKSFYDWLSQKRRHLSVSSLYSPKSKAVVGLEMLFRGLFYLAFVLICIFGNMLLISIATILFLIRYAIQAVVINKTAKKLGCRKFGAAILAFDIALPLISLWLSIKNIVFGKKNIVH